MQACTTTMGLAYLAYRELVQLPKNPPEGYVPLQLSAAALSNWGPYVSLAVPAVMSYCMEGWATEVLIFLSGAGVCVLKLCTGICMYTLLPNADVAMGVTGLCLQTSTLVWPNSKPRHRNIKLRRSNTHTHARARAHTHTHAHTRHTHTHTNVGRLPNADVAVGVTGLCLQFSTLVWLAAGALGSATCTRVSNKVGQKKG